MGSIAIVNDRLHEVVWPLMSTLELDMHVLMAIGVTPTLNPCSGADALLQPVDGAECVDKVHFTCHWDSV